VMDFGYLHVGGEGMGCGWRLGEFLWIGWDPFCYILTADRFEISRGSNLRLLFFGVRFVDSLWWKRVGWKDWMMRWSLSILLEVDKSKTLKISPLSHVTRLPNCSHHPSD
jgi:hypothetical protein